MVEEWRVMEKCGKTEGYELEVVINWEKQGPFV